MKRPTFNPSRFTVSPTRALNQKIDLIEQIVERTTVPEDQRPQLARRLAIAANTLKWTATDLHGLLKKADDPNIRNYTAFVQWSCNIRGR